MCVTSVSVVKWALHPQDNVFDHSHVPVDS